jgi:hypothetical protein
MKEAAVWTSFSDIGIRLQDVEDCGRFRIFYLIVAVFRVVIVAVLCPRRSFDT